MRELLVTELESVSGGSFWGDVWNTIKQIFGNDSKGPTDPCPPGMNFTFTSGGSSFEVSGSGVGPEGVVNFDIKQNGSDQKTHYSCTVPTSGSGPAHGSSSIQQ